MADSVPLIEVQNLVKKFALRPTIAERLAGRARRSVQAVNGVSLQIRRGETLGLIGESGCGKSTLGRTMLRLQEPTSGSIRHNGIELCGLSQRALRQHRRQMQIVFQDPYASLNPRKTALDIVALPLVLHERLAWPAARARAAELLARVGLMATQLRRPPRQFSGGQRQRIGIARALILRPQFVVCDEPVSALDVSIQAQIIELLRALRREFQLTCLFISHDLAVVGYLSDRIAVMYLGEIVEIADTARLIASPAHPYTQALMSAVPRIDGAGAGRIRLSGELPSPLDPPRGCKFHTRCPSAMEICRRTAPKPITLAKGHVVSCHLHDGTGENVSTG
jgi:oligopeptide/dipeptide ABC transporter ATP-binding protein